MQTTTHNTLEEAIQSGKDMLEARPFDMNTFLIIPEVFKTSEGYITVLPDAYFEKREHLGEKIGYVDGNRFSTVEEVRAEVKRDEAIEAADVEAMANHSRRY